MMENVIGKLRGLLGEKGILTSPDDTQPYVEDWRGIYKGSTPCVIRPSNTEEVAAAMAILAEYGVCVVPQGGNTSMVGGATPDSSGQQVILSLTRMNRIRDIDPEGLTITVEAGLSVQSVQEAALREGCVFPLSFGAQGSATVGGALSTNAGGNTALRYGSARDLALGLEVVLADGRIWNGLRSLRKDNTGYSLRNLFISSEGTLGIITAAVLRLVPRPVTEEVALVAVPGLPEVLHLLARTQNVLHSDIRSFEFISGEAMEVLLKNIPSAKQPFAEAGQHYVLIDLASARCNSGLRQSLEGVLEEAFAAGEIVDGVVAQTSSQAAALWQLREEQSEAQRLAGASIKNDVSVPVSRVPDLIDFATKAVSALIPGVRAVPFGHVGDGNIHLNFLQPEQMPAKHFQDMGEVVMNTVAEVVRELGGSFSAEHGIGLTKAEMLPHWHSPIEVEMMMNIKRLFDPQFRLNPGKVFTSLPR